MGVYKIDKSSLVPDMILRSDILSVNNAVVVPKGTVLTENLINRIKRFHHIHSLEVENYADESTQERKLKESYDITQKQVKGLILGMAEGKSLDSETVNVTIDSIAQDFTSTADVLTCMKKFKDSDEYTYTHSLNVSLLCMLMGKWLKLDSSAVKDLATAGLLHDIGKSQIDINILNKKSELSKEEYEEVRRHVTYSYRLLQNSGLKKEILMGILMHHEREDGSGYPLGANSEHIHVYGKILGVCDVYAAMVSNRPYKERANPFAVIKEMQDDYKSKLDYGFMQALFYNVAMNHSQEFVLLNTGETGQISFINPRNVLKPIIRIDTVLVDLEREKGIEIVDIL